MYLKPDLPDESYESVRQRPLRIARDPELLRYYGVSSHRAIDIVSIRDDRAAVLTVIDLLADVLHAETPHYPLDACRAIVCDALSYDLEGHCYYEEPAGPDDD